MDIKDLHEKMNAASAEVKSLVERQTDEIKTLGETTEKTAKALADAEKRFDDTSSDLGNRMEEVEKRLQRPADGVAEELKTAGQHFIESEAYKAARDRGLKSTDAVEVASLVTMQAKDITSAATSTGAVAVSQRIQGVFRDPADRPSHIRDLLDVQNTTSGSIEYYVDHSGFTNNAGSQNGELTAKAKSDLVLEEKTAAVKTLAHHVIASRQVLDDAPMLRGYIDGRLRYGLMLEEDQQILYGDGTGGTLEGIFNAGIQDHGDRPSGVDRVAHVRRAMVKARLSEYPVNGVVLHPEDWAEIELLQGSDGHYIWAWYMAASGEPRIWRVPIIETTAINQSDFLLGNWNLAATLWDRAQSTVRVSDSHADLFVKNGVAILGEERLALTVQRPKAYVKGSFTEQV